MASSRKRYRRYNEDPAIPIPRTTLYRWQKRARASIKASSSSESDESSNSSTDTSCTSASVSSSDNENYFSVSAGFASPESESELLFIPRSNPELVDGWPPEVADDSPDQRSSHDSSAGESENNDSEDSHDSDIPEYFTCMNEPLHQGSTITLCTAILALMDFCLSNRLSYTAIDGLLKLLQLLCVTPNKLPRSVYLLKQLFRKFKGTDYNNRKFCTNCNADADNCSCEMPMFGNLLAIPIEKPLEAIVKNHWSTLQHPPPRSQRGIFSDIWDGQMLKDHCSLTENKLNLVFSLCTDGVPAFKSSSTSLWPVYLVVFNIPLEVRMNADNIILAGLWVGPTKPPMKFLLEPIISNIEQLQFDLNIFGEKIEITGKLVMGLFDLPAKASVLCAKQYNGEYGCSVCIHPGLRLSNGARVYLPRVYPERTNDGVKTAADSCTEGVLGRSILTDVVDLVDSIPVDYMHCYLEGVVKLLIRSWVHPNNHRQPFYIGLQTTAIDCELLKQQPPLEFTRPPRSIAKHLYYWKASELRYWVLYYSLPLLLHRLPSVYWHHYALLVCSLHLLLKSSISAEEIDAAEQMLSDFYALMPELYGYKFCTHNVHLLNHLTKFVRLWGPLWTHSLFGYENKNGHIKGLFHGNDNIYHQIVDNVDANLTLQLMCHHFPNEADISRPSRRRNMKQLSQHCYVLGCTKIITLSDEQRCAIGSENYSYTAFFRLYKKGATFYSTSYVKDQILKRENTFCSFTEGDHICYGQITVFLFGPPPVALIKRCDVCETSLMQSAGHPCRPLLSKYKEIDLLETIVVPITISANLTAVNVDDICSTSVIIKSQGKTYLFNQPNTYERH